MNEILTDQTLSKLLLLILGEFTLSEHLRNCISLNFRSFPSRLSDNLGIHTYIFLEKGNIYISKNQLAYPSKPRMSLLKDTCTCIKVQTQTTKV